MNLPKMAPRNNFNIGKFQITKMFDSEYSKGGSNFMLFQKIFGGRNNGIKMGKYSYINFLSGFFIN